MSKRINTILKVLSGNQKGMTVGEIHNSVAATNQLKAEHIRPPSMLDSVPKNLIVYSHDASLAISELVAKRLVTVTPSGRLVLTHEGAIMAQRVTAPKVLSRRGKYYKLRTVAGRARHSNSRSNKKTSEAITHA